VRLHGILGIGVADEDDAPEGFLPVLAIIKSSGFQKLAKAILADNVPAGHWPQNPNHTAAAIVKGIRKKLKLGEDAAVLYAQLLALPDTTTANLCTWNGWKAGRLEQASAELVGRHLAPEATRHTTVLSLFFAGEL